MVNLPMTARGFIQEVQIMKQNQGNMQLDMVQRNKHRDVHSNTLYSQDYINQFSDYLLTNDNDKVIYTETAPTTGRMVWCTYNIPFAEISPIFGVYPNYPLGMLNNVLQLDFKMNTEAMISVGGTGANYADFELKTVVSSNPQLIQRLKSMGNVNGAFIDYYFQQIINTTRGQEQLYEIRQKIRSLDAICVQAYASKSEAKKLWYKGWSSIDDTLAAGTTISFSGIQLQHNNVNIFTKQLNNLSEIYRLNIMDNNQTTQFSSGAPAINRPETFTKYNNAIYIKLDDF